ncbi:hypothetical protein GN156_10710 [bacterium LRH843]|nr:hypothetical protein [bacterium LRH843]
MELGVPPKERMLFYHLAEGIKTGENISFVYVEPVIKVKVKYRNLTKRGLLRLPSFIECMP